jgi:hypothetical protein
MSREGEINNVVMRESEGERERVYLIQVIYIFKKSSISLVLSN